MRSSRITISRPLRPAPCRFQKSSSSKTAQPLTRFKSCAATPASKTWIRQPDKPAQAQHPTSATRSARAQSPTRSTSHEPPMPVPDRRTQPVFRHQSAIPREQLQASRERTAVHRRLSSKILMLLLARRERMLRRRDRDLLILQTSRIAFGVFDDQDLSMN